MHRHRRLLAAILAVGCMLPGAASAAPGEPTPPPAPTPAPVASYPMVHTGTATNVREFLYYLSGGTTVRFETGNTTSGNPVLHLLGPSGAQVAVNDNRAKGSWDARIVYTPPSSGWHRLVVRARTSYTAGRTDLFRDGTRIAGNVPFGGWQLFLDGLRQSERLETIRLPGSTASTHALYVLGADGLSIASRVVGAGTAGGATLTIGSNLGGRTVIAGVPGSMLPGLVRLVRNDTLAGHDPDADGLGVELERDLGTCSSRSSGPSYCSLAADARDTDGDGISDRWEVFGRRDRYPHQPLALWGADPLHKDLFVEVDYMRRDPNEMARRLDPVQARRFAAIYQDEDPTASAERKASHAATLRNPDGRTGIAVHMDTGVAPASPADITLYGNWGGYSATAPAQNAEGEWDGVDYATAWQTYMSPARYGIFRYALPYGDGGGGRVAMDSFAITFGVGDGRSGAHEMGHALGLSHSGAAMPDGYPDPNCKPNYPSIMNYAFQGTDGIPFDDGTTAGPLNNARATEWQAVSPSNTTYLDRLESQFRYNVDRTNGHVDWNRDGTFAPAATTVRAYANFDPASSCEFTRYNQASLSGASTMGSPALVRLLYKRFIFWTEGGELRYSSSAATWDCPAPFADPDCDASSWSTERTVPGWTDVRGFDVERVEDGYGMRLIAMAVNGAGNIYWKGLTLDSNGGEHWSTGGQFPASKIAGEPTLARAGSSLYLAYKGTDNLIRWNRWNGSSWSGERLALTASGATIATASDTSPALAYVYTPLVPGVRSIYGAFPGTDGRISLYRLDPSTERWTSASSVTDATYETSGRPAMAWVPDGPTADYPGTFYLVYNSKKTIDPATGDWADPVPRTFWLRSYVTRNADGTTTSRIGLNAYFDNEWHGHYGVDVLHERGWDTNLRMAFSWALGGATPRGQVAFRPKADGINDFTYSGHNDWAVLRVKLCRNLTPPGQPRLVSCP